MVRAGAGEFTDVRNESGNQAITIGSGGIHVESVNGGSAVLGKRFVFGAPATDSQTISTSRINLQGGGIQANEQDISASADIRVAGGSIAAFSRQTIAASGGNIEVAASSPGFGASISSFGAQSITVSGGSNNAITVGAAGAQAISQIVGGSQTITAGMEGQQGSITIVGADAPASFVGIVSSFAPGGANTQNVSTSGALTIRGGNSPFQPLVGTPPAPAFSATGISQNASGTQTIQAGAVVLQGGGGINNNAFISSNQGGSQSVTSGSITLIGGASGQNNGAIINSSTGGNQSVTVSGGAITVTGGAGGLANRAGIVTNANQTISGNPDILLTGGAGGGAGNNSNNVFIQATGPDTTQQTINARRIEIRPARAPMLQPPLTPRGKSSHDRRPLNLRRRRPRRQQWRAHRRHRRNDARADQPHA